MRVKRLRLKVSHNNEGELLIGGFMSGPTSVIPNANHAESHRLTAEVASIYWSGVSKELRAPGLKDIVFHIPESSPFFNIDICIFDRDPTSMGHIVNAVAFSNSKRMIVDRMIQAAEQ